MKRNVYTEPTIDDAIKQGAIIPYCMADGYPKGQVHGVIITANCDIAHNKTPYIYYLPIVKIEDWIRKEAYPKLKAGWRKELQNSLEPHFGKGFPVAEISLEDGLKIIDSLEIKEKKKKEVRKKFKQFLSNTDADFLEYLNEHRGKLEDEIEPLIEGDRIGSYFIESWDKSDTLPYKVILLSHIRKLTPRMIEKLRGGFLFRNVKHEVDLFDESDLHKMDDEDFYWVEKQIQSPYIEHIMQRFSHSLCRIGLRDLNHDAIIDHIVDEMIDTNKNQPE